MKKKQSFSFTIHSEGTGLSKGSPLLGFLCSFLLFFFACGSFLLNFSLIFSPGFSPLSTGMLLVFSGVTGALLFALRESRRFPGILSGSCGLLLLLLYLFREDFSRQLSSAGGAIEKSVNAVYNLRIFPGYEDSIRDKWVLCVFLAAFYMLLILLSMLWKNRLLFVLLLGLPELFSYLLEVSMPAALFALPLGAFILWRGALFPESISRLWLLSLPLQGLLFLAAACIFTPPLSPWVFQSSEAFSARINAMGNQWLFGGKTDPAPSQHREEETGTGGFSYESQTDVQSIGSAPPSYTSRTVLSLESDKAISQPLYLRGFIGADYRNYQWSPPGDDEWYAYAQADGLPVEQAEDVYNMPLYGTPVENTFSLSMEFPAAPAFNYLPLAGSGSNIFQSESNRLEGRTARNISGRCFPLTIDNVHEVSMENFNQSSQELIGTYETFCRNRYTAWEEQPPENLLAELEQLPVYSSIQETPSDQDIQRAAEEIQSFLWEHASYSLSLEPFSSEVPLSRELLYEQREGFCIHFATVGTQLFRMYGIPARYVSGYFLLPDMLRETSQGSFAADIPDSRAHAWVEVYTRSAGWIPVEVTPGSQVSELQTGEANAPLPQDTDGEERSTEDTDEGKGRNTEGMESASGILEALARIGKFLLIAVLVLGPLLLLLLFVRHLLFRFRLGYFASSPSQAYEIVFRNLIRLWELEFSIEIRASTDREYFRLFAEKLPEPLKEEFTALYTEAEAFAYGEKRPSPSQLGDLRRYYLRQRKNLLAGKKGLKKLPRLLV